MWISGAVDVDKLVRERDLETLQDTLSNIMSCSLDGEYDLKVLDPNFVKLFRLAQLATDFLLYCRNYLDHCVTVMQEQLRFALQVCAIPHPIYLCWNVYHESFNHTSR